MNTKNKYLSAIIVAGCLFGSMAYADNQTVSIGYAQSKVQDFKNIHGVNLQYRYEWDSPVSIVGSFTYMKGDDSAHESNDMGDYLKAKADLKYYSLLAGPAYRINDYVSLYGLIGAARMKADVESSNKEQGYYEYESASTTKTNFAYGAGIVINPIKNVSVNLGYEGTKIDMNGSHSINGFNLGVGYRF